MEDYENLIKKIFNLLTQKLENSLSIRKFLEQKNVMKNYTIRQDK